MLQEWGYEAFNVRFPPRPFMRLTVSEQGKPGGAWSQLAATAARSVILGSLNPAGLMDLIGLRASADIAKTIASIQSPALEESTIKARQRRYANKTKRGNLYKPLVDTGQMVNSVTYEVEGG